MQYQQGDITIEKIDRIPTCAKKQKTKKIILAEGKATGHMHVVITPGVETYVADAVTYIKSLIPWEIKHNTHEIIEVPPGEYQVGKILAYDHLARVARVVAD